jgi:CHASE2 domain-containing sensor protein
MTMKVNYAQMFQAAPSLDALSQKPFSAKLAIKLVDIVEQLNPHLVAIDRFRDTLSGQTDKSAEELNKAFLQYLNETAAELNFAPITSEEADQAGLAFTLREMASVRFMFSK